MHLGLRSVASLGSISATFPWLHLKTCGMARAEADSLLEACSLVMAEVNRATCVFVFDIFHFWLMLCETG